MAKAILVKINKEQTSRYGGSYIRTFWKDVNTNERYIFDCFLEHEASKRFLPYLKEQTILENLTINKGKTFNYIYGYSAFTYCGIKNENK